MNPDKEKLDAYLNGKCPVCGDAKENSGFDITRGKTLMATQFTCPNCGYSYLVRFKKRKPYEVEILFHPNSVSGDS